MKTRITTTLFLFTLLSAAAGDGVWSYAECVEYARSHNISLQKLKLAQQTSEYNLEEARAQWQPTLDFNTSHNYANLPFGKENKNTYNGQVGFNAAWTVWNG